MGDRVAGKGLGQEGQPPRPPPTIRLPSGRQPVSIGTTSPSAEWNADATDPDRRPGPGPAAVVARLPVRADAPRATRTWKGSGSAVLHPRRQGRAAGARQGPPDLPRRRPDAPGRRRGAQGFGHGGRGQDAAHDRRGLPERPGQGANRPRAVRGQGRRIRICHGEAGRRGRRRSPPARGAATASASGSGSRRDRGRRGKPPP